MEAMREKGLRDKEALAQKYRLREQEDKMRHDQVMHEKQLEYERQMKEIEDMKNARMREINGRSNVEIGQRGQRDQNCRII